MTAARSMATAGRMTLRAPPARQRRHGRHGIGSPIALQTQKPTLQGVLDTRILIRGSSGARAGMTSALPRTKIASGTSRMSRARTQDAPGLPGRAHAGVSRCPDRSAGQSGRPAPGLFQCQPGVAAARQQGTLIGPSPSCPVAPTPPLPVSPGSGPIFIPPHGVQADVPPRTWRP